MASAGGDLKESWTLRDQSSLSLVSLVGPLLAFPPQGDPAHLPLGTHLLVRLSTISTTQTFFVCVGLTILPSLTFNSWAQASLLPPHPK